MGALFYLRFGCANGLILSGARVYYAMAKDGLFFRSVAKLHPAYKTPAVSLMVQMVWRACFAFRAATANSRLYYFRGAGLLHSDDCGMFVLRRTRPDAPRPYRAVGYPVLPAIYIVMAYLSMSYYCATSPQFTWPGLIVVLLGIPVYYAWSRSAEAK